MADRKKGDSKIYFDKNKKVKREIRLIGIDDSPFIKKKSKEILVLGTIHRGGEYLEGIISTYIEQDGENSTSKISQMINKSRHKSQLQCIMLDGIAVGGFNVIDIKELADRTRLPVIVIIRYRPVMMNIEKALANVKDHKKKLELIRKAGKVRTVKVGDGNIFFQVAGVSVIKAKEIIAVSVTNGHMPEPIRTAHIIAAGIVTGESKGRA